MHHQSVAMRQDCGYTQRAATPISYFGDHDKASKFTERSDLEKSHSITKKQIQRQQTKAKKRGLEVPSIPIGLGGSENPQKDQCEANTSRQRVNPLEITVENSPGQRLSQVKALARKPDLFIRSIGLVLFGYILAKLLGIMEVLVMLLKLQVLYGKRNKKEVKTEQL